jgi:HD-GYP domain-containing protein (c-di-GMP phosphodiesterase class II)
LECRILSIADAYTVMTGNRPYRKALSHEEAIAELCKGAGTQFDHELVQKFINLLEKERNEGWLPIQLPTHNNQDDQPDWII